MAARYRIEIRRAAEKVLTNLPRHDRLLVGEAIGALAEDPRPAGCKKLRGTDLWRVRAGEYRVIYAIEDRVLLVVVVRIGHRREAYRRLP